MKQQAASQLDKILALVDSDYEGEALSAVRKARQMLSHQGLSFSDLARAAEKPGIQLPLGLLSGTHIVNLETEILLLRQQLSEMRLEKFRQETQAAMWRQRANDLEQKLNASQTEAGRWRQLARDTVDKLWDWSQSMQKIDQATSDLPPVKSA